MSDSKRRPKPARMPCSCWHCSPCERNRVYLERREQYDWRESIAEVHRQVAKANEHATRDG